MTDDFNISEFPLLLWVVWIIELFVFRIPNKIIRIFSYNIIIDSVSETAAFYFVR